MQTSESNAQNLRLPKDSDTFTAWPAGLGLLVADASLKPIFANEEALAILSYPGPSSQSLADMFHKNVRPRLISLQNLPTNGKHAPFMKFKSGRRIYFCRAYALNNNGRSSSGGSATLIVLERGMSGPLALSQVSRQFHLTRREQQAVGFLLQGFSNKEMAKSMGISANTVKAFLRMASIKMGVSSRSGIVTMILGRILWQLEANQPDASRTTSDS